MPGFLGTNLSVLVQEMLALGATTIVSTDMRGFGFGWNMAFRILYCDFKIFIECTVITLRVSPADVDRALATYATIDPPDLGKCNNIFYF